ncbi:MAG TPA: tetratricopeptide repeat protein [Gemmatimonadaceae bacterium]|jgi:Flp pilus assembly protein TadD|nr:tetratricopeptide repeat protein [Gemmatimonadaceae bacterium]
MSFWDRLFGGRSETVQSRQRLDYMNEALVLERQGDYDAAVTSYRLALRERPDDLKILQNMAIALSRVGRHEEAVRAYRKALEIDPMLSGAHYGLAFLLLKRGETAGAVKHLTTFISHPPTGPEAARWVAHAESTLEQLRAPAEDGGLPGKNTTAGE